MVDEADSRGPAITGNTMAILVVLGMLAATAAAVSLFVRGAPGGGSSASAVVSSSMPAPTGLIRSVGSAPRLPMGALPSVSTTTLVAGSGAAAANGDKVRIRYVGALADGGRFDAERDQDKPIDFTLGKGHVLRGWDQGILGMKVGEKRRLVVPPALAYGSRGYKSVPPDATLTFELELLAINPD